MLVRRTKLCSSIKAGIVVPQNTGTLGLMRRTATRTCDSYVCAYRRDYM